MVPPSLPPPPPLPPLLPPLPLDPLPPLLELLLPPPQAARPSAAVSAKAAMIRPWLAMFRGTLLLAGHAARDKAARNLILVAPPMWHHGFRSDSDEGV